MMFSDQVRTPGLWVTPWLWAAPRWPSGKTLIPALHPWELGPLEAPQGIWKGERIFWRGTRLHPPNDMAQFCFLRQRLNFQRCAGLDGTKGLLGCCRPIDRRLVAAVVCAFPEGRVSHVCARHRSYLSNNSESWHSEREGSWPQPQRTWGLRKV